MLETLLRQIDAIAPEATSDSLELTRCLCVDDFEAIVKQVNDSELVRLIKLQRAAIAHYKPDPALLLKHEPWPAHIEAELQR